MAMWSRRGGSAMVVATAGVLALAACAPAKKAAPRAQEVAFGCTNGAQAFTVPARVHQIGVDAYGAQGGAADNGGTANAPGGAGGRAAAVIPVTPGEVFQVNVGCRGGDAPLGVGVSCVAGSAGFNGGARGGMGDVDSGGGGGGASDVRRGGTDLTNRVIVAGGGGGGGSESPASGGPGGSGGGTTGGDGQDAAGGDGGGGGTQMGGGAAGAGITMTVDGVAGGLGAGGRGGDALDCAGSTEQGGGGGGGGLYGGGGGGGGNDNLVDGGGGGGGGSGFGPAGTTFENGVRAGDGLVRIGFSA